MDISKQSLIQTSLVNLVKRRWKINLSYCDDSTTAGEGKTTTSWTY